MTSQSQLTYGERASKHSNAVVKKLFELAEAKRSNVIISADLTTTTELLDLADRELTSYLTPRRANLLTIWQVLGHTLRSSRLI